MFGWLGNKMLETITYLGKDVTHILPYYIDAYAYLLQPFVCYENTTHSCLDCKHIQRYDASKSWFIFFILR